MNVHIGGRFLGVSTRVDGRTRANFLNDPATGRDRAAVAAVKRAARTARGDGGRTETGGQR